MLWVAYLAGEMGTSRAYNRLRPTNSAGDQTERDARALAPGRREGHQQAISCALPEGARVSIADKLTKKKGPKGPL